MSVIKISVIIPVYNAEKYLDECLKSIVNQTLYDVEIICINDGSADGSLAILEQYAAKDNRVQLISQENKGQSNARNIGMDSARGKYIYFCDSDDMLKHDALETLYTISEKKDLDLLFFDSDILYESKELEKSTMHHTTGYYKREHDYSGVVLGVELFNTMMQNDEYRCSVCLYLLKTAYVEKQKLRFYEGVCHEDDLFTFMCLMNAGNVSHVREAFYVRRLRAGSIMTNTKGLENFRGYLVGIIQMLSFISEQNYRTEVQQQVLRFVEGMRHALVSMCANRSKTDDWINELGETEKYYTKHFILSNIENNLLRQQVEGLVNVANTASTIQDDLSMHEIADLKRQIAEIYSSRTWKIGSKIQKLYRAIIP